MTEIQKIDDLFVANTYKRFPITLVKGKGSLYYDEQGKEYIDMGTGIGVTCFGACDDEWKSAVIGQLSTLPHTSNLYYTEPCAMLAKTLCERTGLKKVFFSNSGAEANECAIKAVRKHFEDKTAKQGYVITLTNSFHGRTLTTLSATGQDKFHELFNPLTSGFLHADVGDIETIKKYVKDYPVCAIMIELVQGEGGVNALSKEFVKSLKTLCEETGALLVVDEVQTGNGRTGKLYAFEHYDILPDVVTTAKGLGGGLPIGACMLGEKVENVFTYGTHGSTFGGNPIASAGALSIINRLTPKFLKEVEEKSKFIFNELSSANGVESISGLGLMIGIKTKKPISEVVDYCLKNGVLVLTAKDKLRLLPPLNIENEHLTKALKIIKQAL